MCTGDSGGNAVRMVSIDCKRSANNDGGVSLGKSKYNVATLSWDGDDLWDGVTKESDGVQYLCYNQ